MHLDFRQWLKPHFLSDQKLLIEKLRSLSHAVGCLEMCLIVLYYMFISEAQSI